MGISGPSIYFIWKSNYYCIFKKISWITKYHQIIPRLLKKFCSFVSISKLNLKHVFVLKWIVLQWTCEPANLLTCGPVDLWTCGHVDLTSPEESRHHKPWTIRDVTWNCCCTCVKHSPQVLQWRQKQRNKKEDKKEDGDNVSLIMY